MPRRSVFDMLFRDVYAVLIGKAERKGRSREEVFEVTSWLLGHSPQQIEEALCSDITCGSFLSSAPSPNPRSELIKGKICGIQVETIEDPLTRRVRQLDKLVDELAKGRPMENVLR